ncbi:MAG: glycosyltransferase family 39 protein, partial [bacterium]
MLFVSMTNRLIGDYGVETDFYVAYVSQAKELLKGNLIIDPYRGPAYQVFLAITAIITKYDYYTAGKLINVICSGITLYFISGIIASVLNRGGALMVVLFVAVNSVFWRYTYEPGTDMLFLAFYTSSLFLFLKSERLSYRNLLTAGILSGMAYLTRYTGISLILFALLIFVFNMYKIGKDPSGKQRNFFKYTLAYLIPVIILASSWGMVSHIKTGHFFYNMNFQNTAQTVYKPDTMSKDEWVSKNQSSFSSMSDVIFRDFGTFTKRIAKNFSTYFLKDIFRFFPKSTGILVGLGLLIFLLQFKSVSLSEKYFFLASFIFYLQILLIFYSERFSLPLLPFYCFLIVKLFSLNFLRRFDFNISKLKLSTLILLLLIIFNFYNSFLIAKDDINKVPVEILTVRDFINSNYGEELSGKSIMARKPHIAYYLKMEFDVMPFAENYGE